jgi:hypothetical protein
MKLGTFNVNVFTDTLETHIVSRDNVVGIATCYVLDGPGIESGWGRDFSHPFRPALGLTQPRIQWASGLFLWVKAARAWRSSPTPF